MCTRGGRTRPARSCAEKSLMIGYLRLHQAGPELYQKHIPNTRAKINLQRLRGFLTWGLPSIWLCQAAALAVRVLRMNSLRPVIWSKGAVLTPQHLQAQDRYAQALLSFHLTHFHPRSFGYTDLKIEQRPAGSKKVHVALLE